MDHYAVIGHPVAHSLSPEIHARFAVQTGQHIHYDRIDPGADGFRCAAATFFAEGGRGLNVTVPFKGEAFDFAIRHSARATSAGVVNTLVATAEGVEGDNTDGVGLVRDLRDNLGLEIAGRRLLLVGAGGAAAGVLGPLLAEGPCGLIIANRTPERARDLAGRFADAGAVAGGGFDNPALADPFDLVINASAASLGGAVPPLCGDCLAPGAAVYDMMYGAAAEPFLAWGREAGAAVVADGLGMLVEQAAESFRVWRGVHPQTAAVLAELRARL